MLFYERLFSSMHVIGWVISIYLGSVQKVVGQRKGEIPKILLSKVFRKKGG